MTSKRKPVSFYRVVFDGTKSHLDFNILEEAEKITFHFIVCQRTLLTNSNLYTSPYAGLSNITAARKFSCIGFIRERTVTKQSFG